jgi:hypothetical protein
MSSHYTLIAALPYLPDFTAIEQLPISRIALQRRLRFLSSDEQAFVHRAELLLFPLSTDAFMTDQHTERLWQKQLALLPEGPVTELCMQKLALDSLLAAIRQRFYGPSSPDIRGIGQWLPSIKRHWLQPSFGLETKFPMVKNLIALAQDNQWHAIDVLISQWLWQSLKRIEQHAPFSFQAVMAYCLRFALAERYLQKSTESSEVMDDLLAECMSAQPALNGFAATLQQEAQV